MSLLCRMVSVERLEPRQLLSAVYTLTGVQPVADDQPVLNGYFHRTAAAGPLSGTDPDSGLPGFNVSGYLDTGTSNILLSQEWAQTLGIASETYNGRPVVFNDVGVGGQQPFDVSEPLYLNTANSEPNIDGTVAADFTQKFGPLRTEISQTPADPNLGTLNIYGMPVFQGKVAVLDPSPINALNNMNAYLYNPGTRFNASTADTNPGIPSTNLHVRLSSGSFNNFTTITPTGAPGPTLSSNPFIGPNPVALLSGHNDGTPPVTISNGLYSGAGSFLFDTGAQTSFMSSAMAAKVHVHYKPGNLGTDNPILIDDKGNPIPNQFAEPVGGIGGSTTVAGFYLSSLSLPTIEGTPIRFTNAPVLVLDVTATNPATHQTLTLDGDFGMNYLVSSTDATLSVNHTGDFTWVTYDQPNGILGLQLPGAPTVNTASISGNVFLDVNKDGKFDTGDTGLAGWTVYIDTNNDGKLDAGDITTTTNSAGAWSFGKLPPGKYVVRFVNHAGYTLSTPASGSFTLTLTYGQAARGEYFGVKH